MLRVRWPGSSAVSIAVLIFVLGAVVESPIASAGDGAGEPITAERAGDLARDASRAFDRFLQGGDPANGSAAATGTPGQPAPAEPDVSQAAPIPAASASASPASARGSAKEQGALGWLNRGYRAFQDEIIRKLATPMEDAPTSASGTGRMKNADQERPTPDHPATIGVAPPSQTNGDEAASIAADGPPANDHAKLEEIRRRAGLRRAEMIRKAEAQRRAAERRMAETKASEMRRKVEAERITRGTAETARSESSQQAAEDRASHSPEETTKPSDRATHDKPATETVIIKTSDTPSPQEGEKGMGPAVTMAGPEATPVTSAVQEIGDRLELRTRKVGRAHEKVRRREKPRARKGKQRSPADNGVPRSKAWSSALDPTGPIARPSTRSLAPRPIARPSL